jgi:hypothetical protein
MTIRDGRHLVLLLSLLLLFLGSPFVAAARYGTVVINTAGVIVLLSGIYAMSEQRRLFVVTLIGSVAEVATNLLMVALHTLEQRLGRAEPTVDC